MDTISSQAKQLVEDLKVAFKQFLRGFAIAFASRTALTVLLRVLQLARKGEIKSLLSIEEIFNELHLERRVEAVRLGLAVGVFSGGFEAVYRVLNTIRGKEGGLNSVIGGFFAGIGLLFLNPSDRRTVSLYALARAAQCGYNLLKSRGMWHFWGSDWRHGDSLLFSLATAQIMYAYVMRPESLPDSYYKFILRTGPIDAVVLQNVRAMNRGRLIDSQKLLSYVQKVNPATTIKSISDTPSILPCEVLHPHCDGCVKNGVGVFFDVAKKISPVYAALSSVQHFVLSFWKFLAEPEQKMLKILSSTFNSTLFLSVLVSAYQLIICMQRKLVTKDYRFIYWVAGFFSGFSILLEEKHRRSELALYALPRAIDSLYSILYDRKWLGSFKHGEYVLFSLCTASIMYCFEDERKSMSPMLAWLLNRIIPRASSEQKKNLRASEEIQKQKEEEEKQKNQTVPK